MAYFMIAAALGMPASFVLAQSQTSPNYKNTDSSIIPLTITAQSSNFKIDGSIEPIVGQSQSGSFTMQSGSQGNPGSAAVTGPPGGGTSGGGGPVSSTLPMLTLQPKRAWTYRSIMLFFGNRGTDNANIFVNDSTIGVRYPSVSTYERDIPLGLGNNEAYAQARKDGAVSPVVRAVGRRRLIGDVNDSQFVDDVDVSLFTRHWKKYDEQSDFNEDGAIDDPDLSLLASHWNQRF